MSKKKIAIIIAIIFVIVSGIFLYKKYHTPKEDTRSVYEALVQVVDQKSGNPDEDKSSSLKKGDVIAVFPAEHPWTDTEKTSYLIVKIKLDENDVKKLTEPVMDEPKKDKDGNEMPPETTRARKYTLDIDVPTVNEIMTKGQPYKDKVFDKGIIEEK